MFGEPTVLPLAGFCLCTVGSGLVLGSGFVAQADLDLTIPYLSKLGLQSCATTLALHLLCVSSSLFPGKAAHLEPCFKLAIFSEA